MSNKYYFDDDFNNSTPSMELQAEGGVEIDAGQFLKYMQEQERREHASSSRRSLAPSDEVTMEEDRPPPPPSSPHPATSGEERTGTNDDDDLESENWLSRRRRMHRNTSSSCCSHPNKRVQEMYTTADWWSLWVGLATFALALTFVFVVLAIDNDFNTQYVIPQPHPWIDNPWDAWIWYNVVGIPLLLMVLASFYLVSLHFMGKLQTEHPQDTDTATTTTTTTFTDTTKIKMHLKGFAFMSVLATLSLWLGGNEWASKNGLGYAVVSVLMGMLLANIPATADRLLPWLTLAAKDGEFFIKASLTLLAVEFDVLVEVGGPAMIVAWVGSPLAVVVGFWFGVRWFGCNDALAMLIAVGASWCGASAITAVAPVVGASSDDVALAVSVVTFFTIIFTFVQPYFALGVGMPDDVAGAWIGGSVDQTGNVIVSAAIVSDLATEVAGIVKMVLNASMGVMASVIACYWNARHVEDQKKAFRCITLWDKFPKFTLGFIITSAILTGTMQRIRGTPEGDALPKAISDMTRWWFAIAFVGIGLTTNIKTAWEKAWNSGILQVYLLANTVDILLALGLAYLAYGPVAD